MSRRVLGALALVALIALSLLGWLRWAPWAQESQAHASPAAADAVASFLARHWADPIAPQGEPPAAFSPLEASLGPEACGQCHPRQWADWQSSLHSRTMGPGIGWQLHVMSQPKADACLRCHAPLAEQRSLVAIERGWPNAPRTPPPGYVPPDLHRQGLVCAACHVRRHARFGPPPRQAASAAAGSAAPHGGFSIDPAFQDSRFCAVCHQFASDGARLNGKLIENTYEEWRASAAAKAGQTCQSCHMPDRRHLWRGIHDADMLRQALSASLEVRPDAAGSMRINAVLANVGAGHYLPTYLIPEIVATLELLDPAGRVVSQLARQVIGRQANLQLTQEIADTRIAPGEQVTFGVQLPAPPLPGWSVELRIVVHPGRHYEKLFRGVLEGRELPPAPATALLRQALQRIAASSYESHRIRKALDAR